MSVEDVILRSTWNPAKEIKREELGNLAVGAPADVAVLKLEKGSFGFGDIYNARLKGTSKLICELTLKNGTVVYDLNATSGADWETLGPNYRRQ
jgi:dihydroorotase